MTFESSSALQSRGAQLIARALAVLLVGVLLWKTVLVRMMFRTVPWSALGFTTTLFLGLLIASVVGLLRMRPWGFYCAYLLVPVSTILHGIALVPFVPDLLPSLELRITSVTVLNVAFLVVTATAHGMYRRSPEGRSG